MANYRVADEDIEYSLKLTRDAYNYIVTKVPFPSKREPKGYASWFLSHIESIRSYEDNPAIVPFLDDLIRRVEANLNTDLIVSIRE